MTVKDPIVKSLPGTPLIFETLSGKVFEYFTYVNEDGNLEYRWDELPEGTRIYNGMVYQPGTAPPAEWVSEDVK